LEESTEGNEKEEKNKKTEEIMSKNKELSKP
jgi:hypothetical protein